MTNLLSNALKLSPPGTTVWLTGEVQKPPSSVPKQSPNPPIPAQIPNPQSPYCPIAVKDQGRGIPPDKLETVFERFGQVDASDSRDKGGTGLSLAICRSIAQQHGGHIWAESVPGEGSTFYQGCSLPPPYHRLCGCHL
ncbi:sensor histidine kinase [Kamptonema formosum]|uniref:sensor histidine kinase n=1 Tax=Kamptonema formosum TaxID=331992 RepID=UPI001E2A1275|nr:ATP-binding protein [Oscillatoria sp. PCC 10802]